MPSRKFGAKGHLYQKRPKVCRPGSANAEPHRDGGVRNVSSVGPTMEKRYDLFELPPDGFPRWVASATTLPEAKKKMAELPKPPDGGGYFVRDFVSGTVVAYTTSLKGANRAA